MKWNFWNENETYFLSLYLFFGYQEVRLTIISYDIFDISILCISFLKVQKKCEKFARQWLHVIGFFNELAIWLQWVSE